MKESPFQTVKEKFKDKQSLIKAVKALTSEELWVDGISQKGLDRVSNRKLLRLLEILTELKSKFGSRGKLIDQLLTNQNRLKDRDYRSRLERFSTPQLWDIYRTQIKRQKATKAG
ncbi:MAG: hypothetical protein JXA30_06430 [Deltaproteobacteria bacterium]|nr:hypothetical protein [Deltaproteobacteria bacterium]